MSAMRFFWACPLFSVGLLSACENPRPEITDVVPPQAGYDEDVFLTLLGRDLVPATILDPTSGRRIATSDGFNAWLGRDDRWAKLAGLSWLSSGALAGTLSSKAARLLPTGPLDVQVTDPRGQLATLRGGFIELGVDSTRPTITFLAPSPDTPFAPGMTLRGRFRAFVPANDRLVEASWIAEENDEEWARASCYVAPNASDCDCSFQVFISQTLQKDDHVYVRAFATDASDERTEATLTVTLHERPVVTGVSPAYGGTAGGTDVVISGTGFLPGSQVSIDGELLFPNGGMVVDEHTISGHTPAHGPGLGAVTVRTPVGDAVGDPKFSYLPPPNITGIAPVDGPESGGTAVTITGTGFTLSTHIYFGQTLADAVPLAESYLQNDTSIIGRSPPGRGQSSVWAFDGSLGFTRLSDAFTWSAP